MRAIHRTRRQPRRGVVLLVVLGLMALFALVGVTFVITSSQYKLGAQKESKGEMFDDPYDSLLNMALEQVLYGTTNRFSSIGPHNLLEDQYGTRAAVGYVTRVSQVGNSSMLLLTVSNIQPSTGTLSPAPLVMDPLHNNRYVGQVITMLTGQLAGKSVRVTGYVVNNNNTATLRLFPFEGMIHWNKGLRVLANDTFVINGRDFSGPGFGYSLSRFAASGQLDCNEFGINIPGNEVALLPNPRNPAYWQYLYGAGANSVNANEPYDAPGYQDMHLAFERLTSSGPVVIKPSFLSRTLALHWQANGGWVSPDVRRRVMFRPIQADHPQWYASINPNFETSVINPDPNVIPVWDVDNNSDGVADSVWIDLGMPVRSDAQGRKYKPLFAILILDQDGKLNVNAHGTLNAATNNQAFQRQYRQVGPSDRFANPLNFPGGSMAQIATYPSKYKLWGRPIQPPQQPPRIEPLRLAVGMNASVGEVSLTTQNAAGSDYALMSPTEFQQMVFGMNKGGALIEGRSGEIGMGFPPKAGITGADDNFPPGSSFTLNGPAQFPFSSNGGESFSFGSPADYHGFVSVGLDYRGQPVFWDCLSTNTIDEPFEIDLIHSERHFPGGATAGGAIDHPFEVEELEWLLRPFDVDMASRTSRLATLCPEFVRNPYRRGDATTDSFYVPMVTFAPTPEIMAFARNNGATRDLSNMSLVDLLAWKIRVASGVNDTQAYQGAQNLITLSNTRFSNKRYFDPPLSGFGWELVAGSPLNLNRPFGNSRDDNNNGVVDEHYSGLSEGPEVIWSNSVSTTINMTAARYQMAMNLYLLAMVLTPEEWVPFNNEGIVGAPGPNAGKELRARTLAQWAVNVVDFRDPDAIMTPFEYDPYPFDGKWDVDGIPETNDANGHLVWGCEHPDLVLTENVAFHNKGTADTDQETPAGGGAGKRTDDMNQPDDDYDQVRIPQGSLFVEMYCVRNPNNPVFPAELSAPPSAGARPGIDLSRLAPAGANGTCPVWRLAITASGRNNDLQARTQDNPDTISYQPYRMSLLPNSQNPLNIERVVWFTGLNANGPEQPNIYNARRLNGSSFGQNSLPHYVVAPGQYAVVGPRQHTWTGPSAQDQHFQIDFTAAPDDSPFYFKDADGKDVPYAAGTFAPQPQKIKRPVGIICGAGQVDPNTGIYAGLSVSEPLFNNYYDLTGVDPAYPSPNPGNPIKDYIAVAGTLKPKDEPYDKTKVLKQDGVQAEGTHNNYRSVLLQRLANPLLPWNPEFGAPNHKSGAPVNPYITVDWMPVDLTVFTSESQGAASNDPDGRIAFAFRSRERGDTRPPAMGQLQDPLAVDIFRQVSLPPGPPTNPGVNATGNFPLNCGHTLGYLNGTYGPGWLPTDPNFPGTNHLNDPKPPFPWLTWNDRPFMNRMELMLVPWSAPARLYREFSPRTPALRDQYEFSTPLTGASQAPYHHLPNFFFSDPTKKAPNLHAILDYVDVPSRFAGTQKLLNPQYFQVGGNAYLYPYVAPYNFFPEFREPGRINLNTIRDQGNTWMGIMNGMDVADNAMGMGDRAFWNNKMISSLVGPPGNPAEFSRPFVFPGSACFEAVPTTAEPVERTLLRREPGWVPSVTEPLLAFDCSLFSTNPNPLLYPNATRNAFNETDRNAYFRYQPLQRLANMTQRSSVYAVWITVGYFEVRERGPNDGLAPPFSVAAYPDGYELLPELGSDTGNIQRHRLFSIIDRSIPVAFQRGVRHNAWDCVKLHRIIE